MAILNQTCFDATIIKRSLSFQLLKSCQVLSKQASAPFYPWTSSYWWFPPCRRETGRGSGVGSGIHPAQKSGYGVRIQDEMRTKGVVRARAGLGHREWKVRKGGASGNVDIFVTWFVLNCSCVQIFWFSWRTTRLRPGRVLPWINIPEGLLSATH